MEPHIIHVSVIAGAFGFKQIYFPQTENFTIDLINCKLANNSSRGDLCLTRDFDTFCYASLSFFKSLFWMLPDIYSHLGVK